MSRLLELAHSLDRDRFVARFGALHERSPWVAVDAWERRPCASIDALHAALALAIARGPRARPQPWGAEARRGALAG
jgi:2-oxo-4-hydroxy-4-carboxy-5-ureidoimidazoline decarboxylase